MALMPVKQTTFNAETAETAEKTQRILGDLRALCVQTSYFFTLDATYELSYPQPAGYFPNSGR